MTTATTTTQDATIQRMRYAIATFRRQGLSLQEIDATKEMVSYLRFIRGRKDGPPEELGGGVARGTS